MCNQRRDVIANGRGMLKIKSKLFKLKIKLNLKNVKKKIVYAIYMIYKLGYNFPLILKKNPKMTDPPHCITAVKRIT